MFRSVFFHLPILICVACWPPSALGQDAELQFAVTRERSPKTLVFELRSDKDLSSCQYTLYASKSRRRLSGRRVRGSIIKSSASGSAGFLLTASGFRNLNLKKSLKKRVRMYFRVLLECGDDASLSQLVPISIPLRKRTAITGFRRWFQHVARIIESGRLEIVEAYPGLTFSLPVDLQYTEDGSTGFIVEQAGRIRSFVDNEASVSSTLFLDIQSSVVSGGERGLLGMALHPEYAVNGYFFVNYTRAPDGATVIARFKTNDFVTADPSSEHVILIVAQPAANHNAGQLLFDSQGNLFVPLGDGGGSGSVAQDPTSFLGSLLRIDIDNPSGGKEYGIPTDNPFVGNVEGVPEETYAFGFRNPFRMSIDSESGLLWLADVGQSTLEEVDIVEAGANYGWDTMEGTRCYPTPGSCNQNGLKLPLLEYSHSVGASITGGYVYRGSENSSLFDKYLFADFIEGRIWSVQGDGQTSEYTELFNTELFISTFGRKPDGEVLFVGYLDGKIYKFITEDS